MGKKEKTLFLTLPNILTLLRIFLVPVFLAMMVQRKASEALFIFLLAGLTDILDGLTARFWHQKTKIGALLDPAADKLLLATSFILLSLPALSFPNFIPFWLVIVVISRDLVIATGAFICFRLRGQKSFSPSLPGKISTVFQVGTVFLVLLFNYLRIASPLLNWIYHLTLAATLVSGIHYCAIGFALIFHPKET